MPHLPWIVLLAPLAACAGITLFTRRSKKLSAGLAIGAMVLSLLVTVRLFLHLTGHADVAATESTVSWIDLPGLSLELGLLMDPLAALMSLVVTGVGLMIFIYSVGYMGEDAAFTRYFAFLSLFAFSMLGIVLANNFVTLFIFWELVGASSYLLIGFWYERPKAAEAGKKAFLVNRIADFGFLIGILMIWTVSGLSAETRTLNFIQLEEQIHNLTASGFISPALLGAIGALIFCGVLGKSAQFPLHVWLPDAMEGPTPVSALIHAATMVAAGVYLICRVFFLFAASPALLLAVAIVGGFTAFFAATLALVENDLKRILAYSTLSQLGTMVMALGLGGVSAGMYHLTTHAFFKALLFLGAGSVIHELHTNDIWKMGGVYKAMPITTGTFLIATVALCGFFPLSGFWSKDEILSLAFAHNKILWIVGTITAGMTAFYMGRLVSVAFLGTSRDPHHHAKESPWVMTIPLVALAVPSMLAGFFGIPHFLGEKEGASHVEFNNTVAIISNVVAIGGGILAYGIYGRRPKVAQQLRDSLAGVHRLLIRKYYVDELYGWINQNVQQRLAIFLNLFERYIIIGFMVNGTAKITGLTGSFLRLAQTGKVQGYALSLLMGLAIFIYVGVRWGR